MKPSILILIIVAVVAIGGLAFATQTPFSYEVYEDPLRNTVATSTPGFVVTHIKTPTAVKGIYMSGWVGGSVKIRSKLVDLIDTTELNAVVLDIKDYTGKLSFIPQNSEALKAIGSGEARISDIREFIAELHEKGIYVIGRLSTFQDPYFVKIHPEYAVKTKSGDVWQDRKGIKWLDAGAQPVWDYFVDIAKESYSLGFDEINFDYIRFPSDGNMIDIAYTYGAGRTKAATLNDFFAYIDQRLRKDAKIPISADFFGMVTSNTDDLGIGQILENGVNHFDFISPMVYPSHYPPNFNGWKNPNALPYELIHFTLSKAIIRVIAMNNTASGTSTHSTATTTSSVANVIAATAVATTTGAPTKVMDIQQIRPWLQDFSLGGITYTADMVRAQIKATNDVGLNSWLLWNASNRYTPEALLKQ